jgi:LPPG:FO 2-phospho-L-lactate transferase
LKVVALAGGTGSAKLLRGLYKLPVDLTVVANVGDNVWMYGVYVCPDIDIACYTLAGIADGSRGWGIAGDTFEALDQLQRLGVRTWFRLGDRDLVTSLARTTRIRSGATLTEATEEIRKALGVRCRVLPLSDDPLETRVVTARGDLHLQEFWVREGGKPEVKRVWYKGARKAKVTKQAASAISEAERVIICPANPVTSIGPMLAIPGFSRLLSLCLARKVAISPMAGGFPFSGPAGKLMKATGSRQDSVGVAELYSKFLDSIMISREDASMRRDIESLGVGCITSDTLIRGARDEKRLARELLNA